MAGLEGGYGADGNAGHSGSDTSREGADSPNLGWRQAAVLDAVGKRYGNGITAREVERAFSIGHGPASGALTRLHRAGRVVRLKERRDGQEVYVTPEYVSGREESAYLPNSYNRKREFTDDQIKAAMVKAGMSRESTQNVWMARRFLDALEEGLS